MNQDHILFFDGVCNLCHGAVRFILKNDKKEIFLFSSLQSNFAKEKLQGVDQNLDTVIYLRKGKTYKRSTAALYVLRDIGGKYKGLYYLIVIPRPVRDLFYNVISKYRYKMFGKKESCPFPSPHLENRFLD